jgi:hypothetical protein
MPAEKKSTLEDDIAWILRNFPNGLGFTELYSKLQAQKKSKGYYHWAASNSTLSETLKAMRHKKTVEKDIDTGNYVLTESGQKRALSLGLIQEIESASNFIRTDQPIIIEKSNLPVNMSQTPTSTYILIEGENKPMENTKFNLAEALMQKYGYNRFWESAIAEISKENDADYKSQKEKVPKELLRGIKKVVLVTILEPDLLSGN